MSVKKYATCIGLLVVLEKFGACLAGSLYMFFAWLR
jgi:hypothetical protein